MAPSDVEDDPSHSLSPEESGDEHGGDMAELSDSRDEVGTNGTKSSGNAKDPLRPRRKKARRACYACQRAHLTCGDERPCQRCIKRGLQDACQDGVRKKAKYLHDAPEGALMPGVGGTLYNHGSIIRNSLSTANSQTPTQTPTQYFQTSPNFTGFPPNQSMPPPMLQEDSLSSVHFGQQSPVNAAFNMSGQQPLSTPPLRGSAAEPMAGLPPSWTGPIFDPSDPALFNFDISSMNFVNHYGALEFGMLGHMATGVGETPPSDGGTQRGSVGYGSNQYHIPAGSFSESPGGPQQLMFNEGMAPDWANGQNTFSPQFQHKPEGPHAFALGSNNNQFASPESDFIDTTGYEYDESPVMTTQSATRSVTSAPTFPQMSNAAQYDIPPRPTRQISTPQLKAKTQLPQKPSRKTRDASLIYNSVTSPYPYTAGFHSLIAYLQRRFASSPSKTLGIAKSLASIRPSFIATTKTLNRDDLIFMEKCFQRTLMEYESFIEGVGTPTIVARRTGEIAAVGREFEILTGWSKKVLLGRLPNLNVNKGGDTGTNTAGPGSGTNTAARGTGANTPIIRPIAAYEVQPAEQRQQPVFLAELLDDDSVVKFYEDFARLAFGDSRGSVMGTGKLLKYRTKDDEIAARSVKLEAEARGIDADNRVSSATEMSERPADFKRMNSTTTSKRQGELKKEGIAGEKGMTKLGGSEGKVKCTYCWTVKRDVFDIPMLIVMNFLPCI